MHTNASLAPEAIDSLRRYLCRHIFTDGHRCSSPALRGNDFCYYHRAARPSVPLSGRTGLFTMPRIDDRAAVQIALYEILSRITAGDLDLRRAGSILYGLQIASTNLPSSPPARNWPSPSAQPPLVEEITRDRYLGDLAPILELPSAEHDIAPALPSAEHDNAPALSLAELALAKPDIASAIAPALPPCAATSSTAFVPDEDAGLTGALSAHAAALHDDPDAALSGTPQTQARTPPEPEPEAEESGEPQTCADTPVPVPPSCYAGSTEILSTHAAEHARSAQEIHAAVQSAIHRSRPALDPETPPSLPASASPP